MAKKVHGLLLHVRYRTHLLVQAPPPPPPAMVVPDGKGYRAGGWWWDPEKEKWSPLESYCACMQGHHVHHGGPAGGADPGGHSVATASEQACPADVRVGLSCLLLAGHPAAGVSSGIEAPEIGAGRGGQRAAAEPVQGS